MPRRQQRQYQYVLNTDSQKIHRLPTREECNLDQVPRQHRSYRVEIARDGLQAQGWSLCEHCFPTGELDDASAG